jgi:hypothetical protein
MGRFISYEENAVMLLQYLGPYLQHFFFVAYELANKSVWYITLGWESLPRAQHTLKMWTIIWIPTFMLFYYKHQHIGPIPNR